MSFVFSFVGSVFIALIILLYNIRDMIIILDLMFLLYYYIYMIIDFFDRSLFLGYIGALCNFISNYLYNILYRDHLCSRI